MLELVELYTKRKPDNVLAKYLPALRKVDGSDSHEGLDPEGQDRLEGRARDAGDHRDERHPGHETPHGDVAPPGGPFPKGLDVRRPFQPDHGRITVAECSSGPPARLPACSP